MQEENRIQFGIFAVKRSSIGLLEVGGRCYDLPIHVGDVVESVYRLTPPAGISVVEMASRTDLDFILADRRAVDLKIERILKRGISVDELLPGRSGVLHLSGSGTSEVTDKDVLGIRARDPVPRR